MSPLRILFDLDGTLLDTAPDLHQALNHCLNFAGRQSVSLESVKHMVGQGARVLLEKGLAATGEKGSEQQIDELFDVFMIYYGEHLSDSSLLFPGVMESLSKLNDAGCELGICTNKPVKFAKILSKDFGFDPFMSVITGGDSFSVRKPHPDHINLTLDQMTQTTLPALMVGDSINDISAAKSAGIANIAVSFGYTDIAPNELGADKLIDHFDELIPAINELNFSQTS
ncbi:phosphoglycolate phosphatase [Sneathiella glossodoripedis]|uniref:phosphoglycolate phosphatase n=1 Tax=Sneathiella glossodoripedis TaxID=418853 RepID=UPI00046F8032|nr:phosphoglycolate phosphatase [Sneathiella glossodoripedis]